MTNRKNASLERQDDSYLTTKKLVPVSVAEAMGFTALESGAAILELGYLQSDKSMCIDVRKRLSNEMLRDLYEELSKIFKDID